jgi:hypothetical protein
MDNPYLDKARRAVDERIERPPEEIQALALVAIAVELQAIRQQLGAKGAPVEESELSSIITDAGGGIVVG